MIKLNSVFMKIFKEDLKTSFTDPSKFLAEFFNGLVIHIEGECKYES